MLSDGTHITLNADSRLKYPSAFDGKTREVYLTGEAFFDVQKDPEHPFIIHTNKINIKVLGTEFNVRCYPDDPSMETTLLRGSIEVTFTDRPADRIILKPKDKLIIGTAAKKELQAPDSIHLDNKTAPVIALPATQYSLTGLTYFRAHDSTIVETSWVDDKLVFRNEEFLSLARKMERWYGLTIHFDNKTIETYHFTGLFQKESVREALYALQLTENFKYKIEGTDVYIF
jgi:ferric-dicitrate binding protein FerR (iron transport regulator)